MRKLSWIIVALCVVASLSSEAIAPAVASEGIAGNWRRTREGWQHLQLDCPAIQYRRPALHPTVVGSLELLLTMTAMLALSGGKAAQLRDEPHASARKVFAPARLERV